MSAPLYYRIRLDPPPRRISAHNNRVESYCWEYKEKETVCRCEISFLQEGTLYELREGREHAYRQGTVNTLVSNRAVSRYSKGLALHEFDFVFFVDTLADPMTEAAVAEWSDEENVAILPEHVTDPTVCRQIANLIKSAVSLSAEKRVTRGLVRRTALYECLYLLTRSAVEQARQNLEFPESSRHPHTERAVDYIEEHLAEQIPPSHIARVLGVSYNVLKSVFRRDMNMSLTDYTNLARIRRVEQLITVEKMTLAQAGDIVGIRDRNYLSRLFHRTTGMTVREYRRVYSEHWEKPAIRK